MARKVLLSGDPEGKLGALFKRVAAVNKSNGPFDLLICVGSFFPQGGASACQLCRIVPGVPPRAECVTDPTPPPPFSPLYLHCSLACASERLAYERAFQLAACYNGLAEE